MPDNKRPTDQDYLYHIATELTFLTRMYDSLSSHDELCKDEVKQRAIIRSIEIIGEAANNLSDEFTALHPDIPWNALVSTRNRLIHGYFSVSLAIIWSILETEVIPLLEQITPLLE